MTHPHLPADEPVITRAVPADAAAILALQKRAFAEEGRVSASTEIPPLAETLDSVLGHIHHQTALVARQGGRIVGSVRGVLEGSVCTVRGLSVEPECHRRGIGAALLRALEHAHAAASGFALTTNTLMPGNVRFYEMRGYRIRELTQHTDRIVLAQMVKAGAGPAD